MLQGYRILQIAAAAACTYLILTFLSFESRATEWRQNISHLSHSGVSDRDLAHIQNETLGFEHIYAIGMKERPDKRDFLDVAASVTGFKVDWLEGVRPDELKQKAMPNGLTLSDTKPAIVACWRAHMNALVKIIENSYSSALIFEDDADWDVNIKSQLHEFARGLHSLQGNEKVSQEHPYGTDWDVLWIGGCGSEPNKNETQFYAIPNDPTLPSHQYRRWDLGGTPDSWKEQFPEDSTRFAFRAEAACCLFGYAVSNRGARKILAALSIDHLEQPVDNAMSGLCGGNSGRRQIDCFATFPQLIGTYRKAGPASSDSEIENYSENQYHEEVSNYVMYSTRRNIHRLVAGEETVYAQWDDVPWAEGQINPKELIYPHGILVN
ncbi:uncharacterized protein N7443_010207 [Penicillium atrosanguineum]|uniref:uncharacterized protein n=1 Tax=Penicillium atrosanguineum TaxID=1132637 RepID=UPI0023A662D0|nr:uncharacterized protein N7443_010207 [Penicillium atrosanguineum]KAJ5289954.1 hypothetical protein N7443_010207 [Penicillium atrosanguineum]